MDMRVRLAHLLVDKKYATDFTQATKMAAVYRSTALVTRLYKQIEASNAVLNDVKQNLLATIHEPTNRQYAILELVFQRGYHNNITHPDIVQLTSAGYIIPDSSHQDTKGRALIRITEKGVNYLLSLERQKTIQALEKQEKNETKSLVAAQDLQLRISQAKQNRFLLEKEEQRKHEEILAKQIKEQTEAS